LDREVTGVYRGFEDVPTEGHHQGTIHRHADPLKDVQVEVGRAALDSALDHSADARPPSEFCACPSTPLSHGSDLAADPGTLFAIPPIGFERELGSPDTGHDRYMFICGAQPRLTCGTYP
jgi:hypothetical protein